MVDEVFKIFDKDGSKTIDKEEAVKHWSKNFGKISANEFFNTVDYNHDGQIQYDEFVDFWKIVKGSGHSEEEIQEEVSYTKYYSLIDHVKAYSASIQLPFEYLKQKLLKMRVYYLQQKFG